MRANTSSCSIADGLRSAAANVTKWSRRNTIGCYLFYLATQLLITAFPEPFDSKETVAKMLVLCCSTRGIPIPPESTNQCRHLLLPRGVEGCPPGSLWFCMRTRCRSTCQQPHRTFFKA
jgi:hypothetical protein